MGTRTFFLANRLPPLFWPGPSSGRVRRRTAWRRDVGAIKVQEYQQAEAVHQSYEQVEVGGGERQAATPSSPAPKNGPGARICQKTRPRPGSTGPHWPPPRHPPRTPRLHSVPAEEQDGAVRQRHPLKTRHESRQDGLNTQEFVEVAGLPPQADEQSPGGQEQTHTEIVPGEPLAEVLNHPYRLGGIRGRGIMMFGAGVRGHLEIRPALRAPGR